MDFQWETSSSTVYAATVCRNLMILAADPHEISITMKCPLPSSTSTLACRARITHYAHSRIWPKCASVSVMGIFFLCWGDLETFRDLLAIPGDHLSLKANDSQSITQKFCQKCDWGRSKNWPKIVCVQFCQKGDETSGQNIQIPKKQMIFFLGATAPWSWKLCGAQFPHRNSEPVDWPLKMPQINGAKPQCLCLMSIWRVIQCVHCPISTYWFLT